VKKIGVWQTAFLGDAVLTLPLLQRLRQAYPEAEIQFFTRGGLAGLFQALSFVNAVRGFDKRGRDKSLASAWRLGQRLAGEGFDIWISTHRSLRSALVAKASGAPRRIGYNDPWFNKLAYTETVDRKFRELAEIERLMELVGPLGLDKTPPWPKLELPEPAVLEAARLLDGFTDGPVLGVHPGSVWPTKRWPAEYFGQTMALAAKQGVKSVLFAGPGEESAAARALGASGLREDAVLDLSGRLSLPVLAACLGRMSVYLSNDSGPMHLAWVQKTPVVALFGPTVRELGFFPRGEGSTVLETDLPCRPCGLHGPKQCPQKHHDCMRRITPEQACAAALGLIGAASPVEADAPLG
jgi:heptosyltransferase-2